MNITQLKIVRGVARQRSMGPSRSDAARRAGVQPADERAPSRRGLVLACPCGRLQPMQYTRREPRLWLRLGRRESWLGVLTAVCVFGAAANSWSAPAAAVAKSCGRTHLRIMLVQDQTRHPGWTTTERLDVFHGLSCAAARRAVTIYFTVGPRPCIGSGCYGHAGNLWCGEDKAVGTAVVCARSEKAAGQIVAELLAV